MTKNNLQEEILYRVFSFFRKFCTDYSERKANGQAESLVNRLCKTKGEIPLTIHNGVMVARSAIGNDFYGVTKT